MSTTDQQAMDILERRRTQLEENVSKLQQALQHWRTWEFEYEMLKEEIQNAKSPSPSQMIEIGRTLEGKLVTEKTVEEFLGKDPSQRTANQIVDMISRRVDYLQQNISTVAKQLDTAEKQLAGTSLLLEADMENEEGLPLMDIQEELDEEGKVLSHSVVQPGKAAPEVVEALRKSGVKNAALPETQAKSANDKHPSLVPSSVNDTAVQGKTSLLPTNTSASAPRPAPPTENVPSSTNTNRDQPASASAVTLQPENTVPVKKAVSFAEDTKSDYSPSGLSALRKSGYNDDLADYNFTKGTKVVELDDDDDEIASYPIIPQGESPEDAELRRQMLQYGLSEVGQVVAEIDLDGRDDDDSEGDYDEDYHSDEEEDEDQYGRSTKREVDDDYRQKMMELEKELNARMLENVGPRPETNPLEEYGQDMRQIRIRKDDAFDKSINTTVKQNEEHESKKKGVRFAENLDVQPAPQPPKEEPESRSQVPTSTSTISDTIVERAAPSPQSLATESSRPTKVSRFKSSRAQTGINQLPPQPMPEPPTVPSGPSGRTLASTVVEHEPPKSDPQIPDELDPVLLNREVQAQYHKMRNKFISQQGGFKASEEELHNPLMEEIDGKPKKVSRFRAARLKADGL
jgi:unconventional prefoldin RPB5 interactor 1